MDTKVSMDTKVNLLGLQFSNPILPASGPIVEGLENLKSLEQLPLGGLVTKTVSVEGAIVPKPCIVGTKHLLYNAELWSELPLTYWQQVLPAFYREKSKPLGISVGYTQEDLRVVVPALTAYADFFEVSTHYAKADLGELVKTMVSLTDKPVMMKLSPHVADPLGFAETVLKNGGKGIVALNSFGPGLALSLKTRGVKIGNGEGHSWVSGAAVKPFVLERISRLREAFPDMAIMGCGGVETSEDVLEMIMAGADLVQVLSSALIHGRQVYTQLVQGLQPAMERYDIESIKSLRLGGFSRSFTPLQSGVEYPVIDKALCTKCHKCLRVCPFEAYEALSRQEIPKVDIQKCQQCGLCESLCPTHAIAFEEY